VQLAQATSRCRLSVNVAADYKEALNLLTHILAAGGMATTRITGALAALLTTFLASGCVSTPVVLPSYNNTFSGMNALFEDSLQPVRPEPRRLRILMIHGMGTTSPDSFNGFISSLASRLQLHQIAPPPSPAFLKQCLEPSASAAGLMTPPPIIIDVDNAPTKDRARLYTYDFGMGAAPTPDEVPILSISFLLWSPLTSSVKCDALAENGTPSRQLFADAAKDFIDDYLADVALYAGTYREAVMRPSIEKGLCYFVGGAPSANGAVCRHKTYHDPTVIITHSLGSYMLMDALHDQLTRGQPPGGLNRSSAAAQVLQRTQFIYMMANQLALLDLTTLTSYPQSETAETEKQPLARNVRGFASMLHMVANEWSELKLRAPVRMEAQIQNAEPENRQIIAFSDPNDILSWLVQTQNLNFPEDKVFLANVYMANNEFTIPPLFSNPTGAHTGYFDNRGVLELMVCGMQNGAIGSCLPHGLQ
jgi:hypothetical protein